MRHARIDLDRPSRCNHGWSVWRTADGQLAAREADERHLTCVFCGKRLPFGESNDTPEAVQVEIHAARLIALHGADGSPTSDSAVAKLLNAMHDIQDAARDYQRRFATCGPRAITTHATGEEE